jgi:hypothetical protein
MSKNLSMNYFHMRQFYFIGQQIDSCLIEMSLAYFFEVPNPEKPMTAAMSSSTS